MDNQNQRRHDDDELEIDLLELFCALKQKIWIIILAAVVCGGLAGAFSKFVITPQYSSTTTLYILSKETTLTSLADLQIGSQLTQDYKIIVTSRPVLEQVVEQLDLGLEYKEIREKISINNPSDTRMLSITAQDPDPYMAKEIADAVANTASEYIGEIMEMVPPKIIERGVVAKEKTSPSNGRNAMLGALAGIVLVCGIIVLEVIMNDTIRTEDDVERYLGLSVLAVVPVKGQDSGKYGYGGNVPSKSEKKHSFSGTIKHRKKEKGGKRP